MRFSPAAVVVFLFFFAAATSAQDWHLGLRANVVTANGEPANDIISTGLFVRRELSDRWAVLVTLDQAAYDFERPWATLGLQQDPSIEVIDAETESLIAGAALERLFGGGPTTYFVGGGIGIASPDVDDVQGPLAPPAVPEGFYIVTDAGNELIVALTAGVRRDLPGRLIGEFALRADHHLADWEVRDIVSGRSTTLEDYTALGAHLALGFRF